ncbi:MAG: tetratricopeptide repeat protein [Anaerolineae bacterium]|nr:tetratricopeptide repeat protein [Anaerolineae bacterium]
MRMRDKQLRTRRLPPPPSQARNLSPARQRAQSRRLRRGRTSTFRALVGWFLLGVLGAVLFVAILSPLIIRSLPPRVIARLSGTPLNFITCLHPDFCKGEAAALPTVSAVADAASLLGQDATPTADAPTLPVAVAPTEAGGDWTVSTNAPTATLIPTDPPPTAAPLDTSASGSGEASAAQSDDATPTAVIAATPTPTVAVEVAAADLPYESRLSGFRWVAQSWNNCGPATLAMDLNSYGWNGTQQTAASYLKPDPEDKNVTPGQMAVFVNEQVPGLNAVYRYAGSIDLVKRLIVAGFPVLIETGFEPDGEEWMGHYRLIVGYSDLEASFYIFDAYLGVGENKQGRVETYDSVDKFWRHFHRVYVVVYRPDQEAQLKQVLGADWDPASNAQNALAVAQREAQMYPDDEFAWFNLGTSYVLLGDYESAARAYDVARNTTRGLPWRMLWYQFGPFEAYLHTGRLADVEALASVNLANTQYVEETYYYQGMVYLQRGETDQAVQKFQEALRHNRNFAPAAEALAQIR